MEVKTMNRFTDRVEEIELREEELRGRQLFVELYFLERFRTRGLVLDLGISINPRNDGLVPGGRKASCAILR
jgi:hypothetical protein